MTSLLEVADRLHLQAGDIRRTVARLAEADRIAGGRGTIYQVAEEFRRKLDRAEAGAIRTVLDEWGRIRTGIDQELNRLDELLKADGALDARIAIARDRLVDRRDHIVRRIDSYARHVQASVLTAQEQAAGIAADEADAIIGRQLGTAVTQVRFDRLPADAVEQLLGQLQAGSPLARLVRDLGGDTWQQLQQELVDGLAFGRNPRTIARRMSQVADVPRWRALTVARTETLRAYREVHRQTTLANQHVVDGVTWVATLDDATCLACWDMHGTHHPPGYTMATHPQCRCTLVDRVKSWAELGIPDVPDVPSLIVDDGPTVFARQSAETQRRILGPARYELYRQGVTLDDMVGTKVDREWGPTSFVRPLADLMAGAAT